MESRCGSSLNLQQGLDLTESLPHIEPERSGNTLQLRDLEVNHPLNGALMQAANWQFSANWVSLC